MMPVPTSSRHCNRACRVYRLYHQALAEYFHEDRLDEDRHRRIAQALIASVPTRGFEGKKVWQEAHPYVLQHLSSHAARGGILADLVHDPLYLLLADPARLLAAIDLSISTLPLDTVRIYKQTVHRLHDARLEEKASYLELSARKQELTKLADQIASLPLLRTWVPKWVSWKQADVHRVFEGHTSEVNCVALGQLGGKEVVISGSADSTVRVWEGTTRKKLYVLKGHTEPVISVALGQLGGKGVVVAGSANNTVPVWEALTDKTTQVIGGHTAAASSAAIFRVWKAWIGKTLRVLRGHTEAVKSVALGQLGGKEVVVSGGSSGTVRVWEASTGKTLHAFENRNESVTSVAVGRLGGREVWCPAARKKQFESGN
jgi:hypothetical protein